MSDKYENIDFSDRSMDMLELDPDKRRALEKYMEAHKGEHIAKPTE